MSIKSKNKRAAICVMVVTSYFVLAALWAILASPETAQADRPGSGVNYKMVIDTEDFTLPLQSAPLLTDDLTDNGDGSPWTFFTRTTVEPTGSGYLIGVGKIGVVVMFEEHRGVIDSLTIAGNDADRVWHVSDVIPVDPPIISTEVIGTDFDVVINADNVNIHRKNKSGPVIGTVAIGTIHFTVDQ